LINKESGVPAYFFRHIRHRHAVDPVKARRRALRTAGTAANGVAPGGRTVLPAGAKILAAMWRLFRR
tara:strand:- start:4121 stop:4321 length:201 start_codon:yes stop_codon:yes gene_type:complete